MDNNSNNDFGQPMQPEMNQQYDQPVQPEMNQQYGQPVQPEMNQQYDQSMQPDMNQSYGQPMQPEMNQQYGQPMQPDMNQQYGQPMQPDMNQSYGQPMQPDMNQSYGQPMQPDMNQQYGQPMQPGVPPQSPVNNGGKAKKAKKPKKPLGKGAIAGIIAGGVALVAAIVCGIIFIPKLFRSDKEVVLDAMEATFSASATNDSYVEDTFGMKELTDKIAEEGGTVTMDFTIDEIADLPEMAGLSFSMVAATDNEGKELGYDLVANYNGTDVFTMKFYADENNTYAAIPDVINGYFTVPNKGAIDAIANSPLGEAMGLKEALGSSASGGDLVYFPSDEETEINSDAVKFVDELWDSVTFEKQGRAKVDVNGETVSAKEYYVTLKEENIEEAMLNIIDMTVSSYSAEEMGVDEASMNAAMSQVKNMIPSIITSDFVVKIYIKDDKIVKMVAADDINIMGVKVTYDCFIDISDDLGGKLELGIMGETAGISFDIADYKNAPNGEIKVYAAGEEFKVKLASTAKDDDKEKSLELSVTVFEGSDELVTVDLGYKLNKSDNSMEYGMTLPIDGKTLSVDAKGQYVDIAKGESFGCNLEEISVSLDGEQLVKASANTSISTKKEVPKLDSSLQTYDITTLTQTDFENLILDNQDNITAWMQRLEDCGLAELLGPVADDQTEAQLEDGSGDEPDVTEEADDMQSVLSSSYMDASIEILSCIPGYEKTYGCEYFIDYENPEGNVLVEYTYEAAASAEEYLTGYTYYDEEAIVSQESNCDLTLSDGSTVKYNKIVTNSNGESTCYVIAKQVADNCVLIAMIDVYDNAATVETVAEALADANYVVH